MATTDSQSYEAGVKGGPADPTSALRRAQWRMGRYTNALPNRRYGEQADVGYGLGPKWARRMAGHFFA
jgi:hypothetical protein